MHLSRPIGGSETRETPLQSDRDLIKGCCRGDPQAWRDVIAKYGRLVYSIPRRYGLSGTDADDVFQAVFAGLHRCVEGLRNTDRISAWLITAAHRQSMRLKQRRPLQMDVSEPPDCETNVPETQMLAWERQNALHVALRELGEPCQQLLQMLFLQRDTPSYDEIARRLGKRVGSIGPSRARCFAKLEAILRRTGLFDDDE